MLAEIYPGIVWGIKNCAFQNVNSSFLIVTAVLFLVVIREPA